MAPDEKSQSPTEGQVLPFRRRAEPPPPASPVAGLDRFEGEESPEEYRHRMLVNLAAFALVVALAGAGYWIADSMARMRKNQDCVLAGRAGCTPVEYTRQQ